MAPSGTIAHAQASHRVLIQSQCLIILDSGRTAGRYGHCQATEDNVEITVKSSILSGSVCALEIVTQDWLPTRYKDRRTSDHVVKDKQTTNTVYMTEFNN
ncbi:hypothetical protein LshimejAT787_2001390 [Lyophyllum shimeji]|uniref:Uncharacterized protein n=1 Tax=Lyophyllum shimeji TaxID=47721 RepID=A0A9P3URL9_LYOSH|nr:hypothetical protein LshimejAT787_2001390 [Lyophyllum shimeji]